MTPIRSCDHWRREAGRSLAYVPEIHQLIRSPDAVDDGDLAGWGRGVSRQGREPAAVEVQPAELDALNEGVPAARGERQHLAAVGQHALGGRGSVRSLGTQ